MRRSSKNQEETHNEDTYIKPNETIRTPYDALDIQNYRHLNNQATYLVTRWSPEILSQEQIQACINTRFQSKYIHIITHQTGQLTYEVHLKAEAEAPAACKQRLQPPRKTNWCTPPENPLTTGGWQSPNLTFSTIPVNPDLDTHPIDQYEITYHPMKHTHTHIHIHTHTHTHTESFRDYTAPQYTQ